MTSSPKILIGKIWISKCTEPVNKSTPRPRHDGVAHIAFVWPENYNYHAIPIPNGEPPHFCFEWDAARAGAGAVLYDQGQYHLSTWIDLPWDETYTMRCVGSSVEGSSC